MTQLGPGRPIAIRQTAADIVKICAWQTLAGKGQGLTLDQALNAYSKQRALCRRPSWPEGRYVGRNCDGAGASCIIDKSMSGFEFGFSVEDQEASDYEIVPR